MLVGPEKADHDESPPYKNIVSLSNALAIATHNLTLPEKRVVSLAISKINPKVAPRDPENIAVRIDAAEYISIYSTDRQNSYSDLKSSASSLLDCRFRLYQPEHLREGKAISKTIIDGKFISSGNYSKGSLEVILHPQLIRNICPLSENFTRYRLQPFAKFRSVRSWRLMELILKFQSTGYSNYSVADLNMSLAGKIDQVVDFSYFRSKIIDPAIKEISGVTGLKVELKFKKFQRKIIRVTFEFDRQLACQIAIGRAT